MKNDICEPGSLDAYLSPSGASWTLSFFWIKNETQAMVGSSGFSWIIVLLQDHVRMMNSDWQITRRKKWRVNVRRIKWFTNCLAISTWTFRSLDRCKILIFYRTFSSLLISGKKKRSLKWRMQHGTWDETDIWTWLDGRRCQTKQGLDLFRTRFSKGRFLWIQGDLPLVTIPSISNGRGAFLLKEDPKNLSNEYVRDGHFRYLTYTNMGCMLVT